MRFYLPHALICAKKLNPHPEYWEKAIQTVYLYFPLWFIYMLKMHACAFLPALCYVLSSCGAALSANASSALRVQSFMATVKKVSSAGSAFTPQVRAQCDELLALAANGWKHTTPTKHRYAHLLFLSLPLSLSLSLPLSFSQSCV
jgi:hypothetical protein